MWPTWSRSPGRVHHRDRTTATCNPTTSSSFACSTFKDIEAICSKDSNSNSNSNPNPNPNPNPTSGSNSPIWTRFPSICHRVLTTNRLLRAWSIPESLLLRDSAKPDIPNEADPLKRTELGPTHVAKSTEPDPTISLPGTETRIVIYYTSLRVVRPTFEACKSTLSVLQSFRVPIDERDLSMDASFLSELKYVIKDQTLTLPRVFIGGRYVGGADEIRQLHECGELKKLLAGMPTVEPGVCQACGGFRFLLCVECSGARKVYAEKGGFRSCTVCNENGLVKCPNCSFHIPLVNFEH
uniref:Glutaredoxin domain-containing protein n=1 Tax=Kalanchoe fedtschenkoi TaxID=63787 RepID=A0A7N0TG90_KALFE